MASGSNLVIPFNMITLINFQLSAILSAAYKLISTDVLYLRPDTRKQTICNFLSMLSFVYSVSSMCTKFIQFGESFKKKILTTS